MVIKMIFDYEHKVIMSTLIEDEARDYVRFLEDEIDIHKQKIQDCYEKLNDETEIYKLFLQSSMSRHLQDIVEAFDIIREVQREVLNEK